MRPYDAGITLVELLFALAIVGILLLLSVGLRNLVADNRRAAIANEFLAALNYARSEAVSRGLPVSLCRSADQVSCGGGSGWESGWIIFTDPVNPGFIDPAEQILKVRERVPVMTMRGNTNVANRISYNAFGTATGIGGSPSTNGTVTLCDERGYSSGSVVHARNIRISIGGRTRVCQPPAALCPAIACP